jgi:hypothetical protein
MTIVCTPQLLERTDVGVDVRRASGEGAPTPRLGYVDAASPRQVSTYVPPQHGAWAFLGLPLVLGLLVTPWNPLLLVLVVAWVGAYPLSYAALGLVRAKRPRRFRMPFLVWSAVVAPAAVVLAVWRPWLVWVGLLYAALFAVNLAYARENNERALVNDFVFVVECSAMVPIAWAVGTGDQSWTAPALDSVPDQAWILTAVSVLVLVGSTLHVKSLIRERRDRRYARASLVVALASVPAATVLAAWWGWPSGAWLIIPFLVLAARALVVPGRAMRPGAIGMIELACFLLVAVSAVLAGA